MIYYISKTIFLTFNNNESTLCTKLYLQVKQDSL